MPYTYYTVLGPFTTPYVDAGYNEFLEALHTQNKSGMYLFQSTADAVHYIKAIKGAEIEEAATGTAKPPQNSAENDAINKAYEKLSELDAKLNNELPEDEQEKIKSQIKSQCEIITKLQNIQKDGQYAIVAIKSPEKAKSVQTAKKAMEFNFDPTNKVWTNAKSSQDNSIIETGRKLDYQLLNLQSKSVLSAFVDFSGAFIPVNYPYPEKKLDAYKQYAENWNALNDQENLAQKIIRLYQQITNPKAMKWLTGGQWLNENPGPERKLANEIIKDLEAMNNPSTEQLLNYLQGKLDEQTWDKAASIPFQRRTEFILAQLTQGQTTDFGMRVPDPLQEGEEFKIIRSAADPLKQQETELVEREPTHSSKLKT